MAEMTDQEVESRLAKYRAEKKVRRAKTVAGTIGAVVLVVGGIIWGCAHAESKRIAVLESKPLREWTAQEKDKYAELYNKRMQNEFDWRDVFKVGVYSPIGNTTIKGSWVKDVLLYSLIISIVSSIIYTMAWTSLNLSLAAAMGWILGLSSSIFSLSATYLIILWLIRN